MSFHGRSGDVVETERGDSLFSSFEWRIPDFHSLAGEGGDRYGSPLFDACGGEWCFITYPRGLSRDPPSKSVTLILTRRDAGPPQTFHVTLGIRGAEGVENKRERIQEFSHDDPACIWLQFCLRSKLREQKSRLMPGNVLVISLDIKSVVPNVARGELPPEVLVIYSYKELETATQNFCDRPLQAGGCKIGEGGFATVYRADIRGEVVAVKRLKDPLDTQFVVELKTLTNYKHENLVPLLGFSLGPTCCLLYEYMLNGSLEDRLACKNRSEPLTWQTRLSISYGSTLGINHLHTFGKEPVVHRDIKSANILLDGNFVAKVGDFGLVRAGSSGGATTVAITKTLGGTPGYMPREALVGDVSVKWDTFSFGVLLLELLTGLPPYDPSRKDKYLITHMENCKDILRRLDPKAKWDKKAATELYSITQNCLAESKKSRPYISEILEDLRKLSLLR